MHIILNVYITQTLVQTKQQIERQCKKKISGTNACYIIANGQHLQTNRRLQLCIILCGPIHASVKDARMVPAM